MAITENEVKEHIAGHQVELDRLMPLALQLMNQSLIMLIVSMVIWFAGLLLTPALLIVGVIAFTIHFYYDWRAKKVRHEVDRHMGCIENYTTGMWLAKNMKTEKNTNTNATLPEHEGVSGQVPKQ